MHTHSTAAAYSHTLCSMDLKKTQVFLNVLKTANQSKPNSAVKEAIQTRNLGSH